MHRAVETSENAARREISRRVVTLLKDYVGRGPRHARTFVFERMIVVILKDTLTKAEVTLAGQGDAELVRTIRRSFAEAMRVPLAALVEEQSGHEVEVVMADFAVAPDYAVGAFLLAPGSKNGGVAQISFERRGRGEDVEDTARSHAISDGIVALFKEYVGRGPRQARTFIDEDVVVVLLEDTLTKAELTLAEEGRVATVNEIRREFQSAMAAPMRQLVEQHTGRGVETLLSDNSVVPDYGIEIFVLDPDAAERGP